MKKRAITLFMAALTAASTLGTAGLPVLAETVTIDVGTFTNIYTPTAVDVNVDLKKVFTDTTNSTDTARKLADKEFTFSLQEYTVTVNDDKTVTWGEATGKPVTAQNDANGNITFKVTYDKTGTHYYKVTEVKGPDTHITYDTSTIEIKVDVTGSNGVLSGKVTYPDDVTFENTYAATSGSIVFTGKKVVEDKSGSNRQLAADEFEFALVDSDGKEVETAKNKTDGSITFGAIEFKQVGTYTYTVKEKAGSVKGFTYDSKVKTIQFVVTDDNGTLKVSTATVDKTNVDVNAVSTTQTTGTDGAGSQGGSESK